MTLIVQPSLGQINRQQIHNFTRFHPSQPPVEHNHNPPQHFIQWFLHLGLTHNLANIEQTSLPVIRINEGRSGLRLVLGRGSSEDQCPDPPPGQGLVPVIMMKEADRDNTEDWEVVCDLVPEVLVKTGRREKRNVESEHVEELMEVFSSSVEQKKVYCEKLFVFSKREFFNECCESKDDPRCLLQSLLKRLNRTKIEESGHNKDNAEQALKEDRHKEVEIKMIGDLKGRKDNVTKYFDISVQEEITEEYLTSKDYSRKSQTIIWIVLCIFFLVLCSFLCLVGFIFVRLNKTEKVKDEVTDNYLENESFMGPRYDCHPARQRRTSCEPWEDLHL